MYTSVVPGYTSTMPEKAPEIEPTELKKLLHFAQDIAREAGQSTLQYFQADVDIVTKADGSPVTIADQNAELSIKNRIQQAYPEHGIIGEEHGTLQSSSPYTWLIDPIDGTKSFVRGVPLYATLLSLQHSEDIVVGLAYFPALDLMVSAAKGLGATANGRACQVSQTPRLSEATVCHIDTASFARVSKHKGRAWSRLQNEVYYNAGWCDAYGYALVAMGQADIALDPIVNPWDVAPFACIIPEAGGYFGDWSGRRRIDAAESLATNAHLKDATLQLLRE